MTTNYDKYFGTPKRAAATMYDICAAELCGDSGEGECALAKVVCCVDYDLQRTLEEEADDVQA